MIWESYLMKIRLFSIRLLMTSARKTVHVYKIQKNWFQKEYFVYFLCKIPGSNFIVKN